MSTLYEILQRWQGYQVKVGADTAFFYCEICDENIYDIIEKMSQERHVFILEQKKRYTKLNNWRAFKKIYRKKYINRIKTWRKRYVREVEDKIKENNKNISEKDLKKKSLDYRKKDFKNYFQELCKYKRFLQEDETKAWNSIIYNYKRYTRYVKEWKPFLDREVLDIYEAQLYPAIIIKIEGPEHSPYWDRDEYLKGVRYNESI